FVKKQLVFLDGFDRGGISRIKKPIRMPLPKSARCRLDRGELFELTVADSLRSASVLRQRRATGFDQTFGAQKFAGLSRTGP
ncbi:MAG: hypothetical protein FWE04_00635, partial [Oscillospiraceae bacterium]|nr:hypothetical protein [Oscillospiraceae bacterium]